MFTHEEIWSGVENLAKSKGMTVSALAKNAGMDATSFNKSKRFTRYGQESWLSTESLSKILEITETDLSSFARMIKK